MSQQDILSSPLIEESKNGDISDTKAADSNRFSLNLDDFEKVDADQLQSSAFASSSLVSADNGKKTASSDHFGQLDNTTGVPISAPDMGDIVGIKGTIDDPICADYPIKELDPVKSDSVVPESSNNLSEKIAEDLDLMDNKIVAPNVVSYETSAVSDLLSSAPSVNIITDSSVDNDMSNKSPSIPLDDPFHNENITVTDVGRVEGWSPNPISAEQQVPPVTGSTFAEDIIHPSVRVSISPSPIEPETITPRETTPSPREQSPVPRQPSPVPVIREPTPPPREPTPPPREPTPPPRAPTPPPREPTPPPREPTPPPREPTPPPKEPTPPPKEPTPPPKEPTPPPKEPTPPPKEPTPPPKEPTPPPKEPTPPPKEPTPPPKEPTPPPKEPTPPPKEVSFTQTSSKSSVSAEVSSTLPQKEYPMDASTAAVLATFDPRAWFHPEQLDPRVAELIYWRDVKKSGGVLGGLLVLLFSLTIFSLISVLAYTALAVLISAIAFRIYKSVKQAIQKTQDGHPFKEYLALNPALPATNVHSAVDVTLGQLNTSLAYLQRIFLVEDIIDSFKFGCYLWVLTYIGAWLNGLTLIILAVMALFSLPKAYEQNKAQVDQYMDLAQQQVNQVLEKVKGLIPIGGNKDKEQ